MERGTTRLYSITLNIRETLHMWLFTVEEVAETRLPNLWDRHLSAILRQRPPQPSHSSRLLQTQNTHSHHTEHLSMHAHILQAHA